MDLSSQHLLSPSLHPPAASHNQQLQAEAEAVARVKLRAGLAALAPRTNAVLMKVIAMPAHSVSKRTEDGDVVARATCVTRPIVQTGTKPVATAVSVLITAAVQAGRGIVIRDTLVTRPIAVRRDAASQV